MKKLKIITEHFKRYNWFERVDATSYKNEYVIYTNKYPYMDDRYVFEYEKLNKVRLHIRTIGG
jgi:hypothetical protein